MCPVRRVSRWNGCKFMRKLKYVKERLKLWNSDVFRDIRVRKREALKELDALDKLESEGGLQNHLSTNKVSFIY